MAIESDGFLWEVLIEPREFMGSEFIGGFGDMIGTEGFLVVPVFEAVLGVGGDTPRRVMGFDGGSLGGGHRVKCLMKVENGKEGRPVGVGQP